MKNHFIIISRSLLALCILFSAWSTAFSQEEETGKDLRPVKNMFESIWLIDNQTAIVPIKGTFEFDIIHRFGLINSGYENFYGFYSPANIRLGFGYVPVNKLMVGFGITKANFTWDLNAKYVLLEQARSGGSPVNLTYFVNMAFDTRDKDFFLNPDEVKAVDRVSYFHQLMVARKISDKFSMQAAGSLSHFNTADASKNSQNEVVQKWENNHFALAVLARYKVGAWVNLIANYDQPLTKHNGIDTQPNVAFGVEMTSSSHAFQVFAGNFYNITPQRNNVFNTNNFGDGDILIGFNITRLWNW